MATEGAAFTYIKAGLPRWHHCNETLGSIQCTEQGLGSLGKLQADGKCLQTGPALSDEPFPPFLIAIPPDGAELLPGNKTARAFLLNPLGMADLQVVLFQPRRKEANTADASFVCTRPALSSIFSCLDHLSVVHCALHRVGSWLCHSRKSADLPWHSCWEGW